LQCCVLGQWINGLVDRPWGVIAGMVDWQVLGKWNQMSSLLYKQNKDKWKTTLLTVLLPKLLKWQLLMGQDTVWHWPTMLSERVGIFLSYLYRPASECPRKVNSFTYYPWRPYFQRRTVRLCYNIMKGTEYIVSS
jgi:hypothetical protein